MHIMEKAGLGKNYPMQQKKIERELGVYHAFQVACIFLATDVT